jgi:hypothetical protein
MVEKLADFRRRDLVKREAIARDGLIARVTGSYAKEKLSFIDEFGRPALDVSVGKIHRYYLDFFAGSGLNIDKVTGEEFAGAALRALRLSGQRNLNSRFTNAVLVNKDPRHYRALNERIPFMNRVIDASGMEVTYH